MRRLLSKLAARVSGGKSLSHAYTWGRFLTLTKPMDKESGEIRYRGKVVGTLLPAAFLSRERPREINVVGSGPSVRDNDLARLADETAILLNGAILLIGETVRRPLAVAIEDERFVHRHFEMMRDKVPDEAVCLLSVEVLRAICEKDVGWLARKRIVLIDNIRKPYAARRRSIDELQVLDFVVLDEKKEAGISLDPDFGVFQGGSVVISAVQFAMKCGPETIGLFGIDIGNAGQPRFYEKKGETARSGVAQAQARIVSHLSLAQQVANTHGQTFRNYSAVSVLCDYGFPYDSRYLKAANDFS